MLLAAAYKKMKDKKDSSLLPTSDPRLSSESVTVPLNDSSAQPLRDGIQRQPSVVDVENKAAKRQQLKMLAISMFLDVVLPVILYYVLKSHISTLAALLISSAPPALNTIFKIIVYRKVDPIGILVLFGFVLSAILSVVDGDPRVLLLRDSFVTGATGVIFMVSLIPLKIGKFEVKPLTAGVSAQMMAAAPKIRYFVEDKLVEQTRSDFCWQWSHQYRRGMRASTLAWGVALLAEFALRLVFYFSSMTIDQLVMWGNIVLACCLGTAGVLTFVISHFVRKWTTDELAVVKAQLERDHDDWKAAHATYPNQQQQQQQQGYQSQQQQQGYPLPQQDYQQQQQGYPLPQQDYQQQQQQQQQHVRYPPAMDNDAI
ncbi:hypothetical protein EMPS_03422 [Entomortierella parvispora]|uniref:Transmembrane protein n=1 Tax=Entomortierella parvispora TaxID=205924 RepID=A0A9P3H7C4_9FUNG|nr:hypothetical protein EMPS_03422 [Entomortierella parvispora]